MSAITTNAAVGRIVQAGTAIAVFGAGVALVNRATMPRLRAGASVIEPVTVCIPARDEADRLPELIADLRAQQGVPRLRVFILDDASTDGTEQTALDAIGDDTRFTLVRNDIDPPPGWNGKTAACAQLAALAAPAASRAGLAERATSSAPNTPHAELAAATDPGARHAEHAAPAAPGALVFLDADVRLAPGALAAAVTELRRSRAALVCPWPNQRADSPAELLVQPLLAWSWAATLPIAVANRTLRPSTAVACGQFLVFDTAAYQSIGGHAAVAGEITEDLAIARVLRHAGHRTTLAAAGPLASTRMYRSAGELDTGYTRWLWSALGGTAGSTAIAATTALAYWVPPLAALLGRGRVRRTGLLGYAAAVTARLLARSTETRGPLTPADTVAALAHPLSIAAYLRLTYRSHRAHRGGTLSWKGRSL